MNDLSDLTTPNAVEKRPGKQKAVIDNDRSLTFIHDG